MPADLKAAVEEKSAALKKALESNDTEAIKKQTEELINASHKLAEMVYKQAGEKGGGAGAGPDMGGGPGGPGMGGGPGGKPGPDQGKDENVVDAEFKKAD